MSKLSIIVPVYFNESTLDDLYLDLEQNVLKKLEQYEIIFVDDGSEDNSWEVLLNLSHKDSNIRLVKLSRNFGSHSAILAGLTYCTGDCAVIKAADLQEESTLLLQMYESWKKGNNVVLAVRQGREDDKVTSFFANFYYAIVRKLISVKMPKNGFDIFLIDRKVITTIINLRETNATITLLILWAGFKTDTVYYVRKSRQKGKSRWTLSKKIKMVFDSIMGFSYIPIRVMSITGFLLFIVSIIWAIVLIVKKLLGGIPIQGWTTLSILVLCSSGVIMLMLGILGEYLWRALDASRNRSPFIVEETNYKDKQNDI